jgi:hypothetical protein
MSDFTKKNIAHFDGRAATYDASVFKTGLSTKAVNAFLAAPTVDWNPASTVVVDFACGTGPSPNHHPDHLFFPSFHPYLCLMGFD